MIAPREATLEGAALAELIREAGITAMQATPVTWRMLLQSGWKGARGDEDAVRRRGAAAGSGGSAGGDGRGSLEPVRSDGDDDLVDGGPGAKRREDHDWTARSPTPRCMFWTSGERRCRRVWWANCTIGGRGLARGYRHREEENRERFIRSERYGDASVSDGRLGAVAVGWADRVPGARGSSGEAARISGLSWERLRQHCEQRARGAAGGGGDSGGCGGGSAPGGVSDDGEWGGSGCAEDCARRWGRFCRST